MISLIIVSCIILGLLLSLFFFDVVFQQPIHEISLSVSLLLGWLWILLHRLQSLLEVVHGCVHVGAILGEVCDRLRLCCRGVVSMTNAYVASRVIQGLQSPVLDVPIALSDRRRRLFVQLDGVMFMVLRCCSCH